MSGTCDGLGWCVKRDAAPLGEPYCNGAGRCVKGYAVVADTTAGEAEDERHALRYRRVDTGTLYDCACGDFTDAAEPTDEDHRRVYEAHAAHILAARSGGAQDDGLRARLEALVVELDEMSRNIAADARQAQEHGEGTYVSFWLGMAQARGEAADRLRRALAGPDDTQQDGGR